MVNNKNYLIINKETWNKKTESHYNSKFYNVKEFIEGKSSLNEIELSLLGEIKGKNILHLQCHFGQDSISLARLGAIVTAIDISDKSIEKAKHLASQTGNKVNFICCDIYDLPNYCSQQFDLVFTSYGVIGWLPDLQKWANIISFFLKPNGRFIFVEFHPVVWMFDDDFKEIKYNYFLDEPIIETEKGTYADRNANFELTSITWNHSLSEVLNGLINHGLCIEKVDEYDYSPYNCLRNMIEFDPGKFRIQHLENKIPIVYSIIASKIV